jgi:putative ABC transport system permease protein
VVLVNETLARRYLDDDPVGEQLRVQFWGPEREMEVVGVVADVRTGSLEEPPPPTLYVPHGQAPTGALTFVVRTAGAPGPSMEAIRRTLWQFHDRMPIEAQTTLPALLRDSLRTRRFHLFLLGAFSVIALALAGIGIYGVISYATRRRTREFGIRMALGATARDVMAGILGRGALLVGAGLAVGLAGALAAGRALESLLYGVRPSDPVTLLAVVGVLGAIGLIATLIPARAAASVDPTAGMREE